jgi:hypothetical protein
MGHYVRDNYSVLSNMALVYHIVDVRVIWTFWAHIWSLHFRFLITGFDNFVLELNTKNLGNSPSFLTITHMTLSSRRSYGILMINIAAKLCIQIE